MGRFKLPEQRVMNHAFAERGRRDVVLIDDFPITEGERLVLTFESVNSAWRQGVWMKASLPLVICEQSCPSAVLWQDTAPPQVPIECHTRTGHLVLYNVWDEGQGHQSQADTSGMLVEELPGGRRYRCNDYGFDTDFSRLVFRLERR